MISNSPDIMQHNVMTDDFNDIASKVGLRAVRASMFTLRYGKFGPVYRI